ncbi:MAG: PQQ-dependent sugar dehydrogenase [Phycisphaerales bacterium]|nr:PQQ-dependent sugar dehydrogenase [Phycisphaerales bacterium]
MSMPRLLGVSGLLLSAVAARAQIADLQVVQGDLSTPLYAAVPPGEPNRLMVLQRGGVIRVIEDGVLLPTPFATLSVDTGGENGLLSMAFAPDYAVSRRVYVYDTPPGLSPRVGRLITSADPNVANPTVETIISFPPDTANHVGGTIAFGPGGYLFVAPGESGSPDRAQDITSELRGKLIRIDVSGTSGYTIPPSNPFVGIEGDDEILGLGLRNPFRFSFDSLTGDLYLGDVGGGMREEISSVAAASFDAGAAFNFGWPCYEGTFCPGDCCEYPGYVAPIHEYTHAEGTIINGGMVYRGDAIPRWRGRYFFSDTGRDRIWSLRVCGGELVDVQEHTEDLFAGAPAMGSPIAMVPDANDEVLVVFMSGQVVRIVPQSCPGDWNLDGATTSADITGYLSAWFADLATATLYSDLEGNCSVSSADIIAFLGYWFDSLGC